MPLQKNDFIEMEFTGKIKDGSVFDSNIKEDLEKLHEGHDHPVETKPLIFPLGQRMFLEGIDNFLIGKDIGEYEIELSPEKYTVWLKEIIKVKQDLAASLTWQRQKI